MKIGDQTTSVISTSNKKPRGKKQQQQVIKTLVSKNPLRYKSKTVHVDI